MYNYVLYLGLEIAFTKLTKPQDLTWVFSLIM